MLVVYNPHVDDMLAEPPHFRFVRRRPLKKYGHLLPQIAAMHGGKLPVFVDATISAFIPQRIYARLPAMLRRFVARLELSQWARINGLKGQVLPVADSGANSQHVLLMFTYKAAVGAFAARRAGLERFRGVIAHLSHYFISTAEKSANLSSLPNVFLAGDTDISWNSYFLRFFPWYRKPILLASFEVTPRFRISKPQTARQERAVAMGTFHNLEEEAPRERYQDYMNFFGSSTYHPVRKLIHDAAQDVQAEIECRISAFRPEPKGVRWFKQIRSYFSVAQKSYFAMDIVQVYNEYRYAIVGEEASGFPALGAFEAMGCGCVLLAQAEYYRGLGLEAGVHFVAHDGSLQSIIEQIRALRADPQRANSISEAGRSFVEREMRREPAFQRLLSSAAQAGVPVQ